MKKLFLCLSILCSSFGKAQDFLLLNNIDSTLNLPDTISAYYITVNDADSIPENKKIRNLDFLKHKTIFCNRFRITNSLVSEINSLGNGSGIYNLLIQNNGQLKKISNLSKTNQITYMEISYNYQLDTITTNFDSLYFAAYYGFYGNQSLKFIDLNFDKLKIDTFIANGSPTLQRNFTLKFYNNDSLEKINIKTKNRVMTILDVQGNPLLKSVDINKLMYDDSSQLKQYEFDYWFLETKRTSTNIFLINNASLTHFGGFEKDSFTLCSSRILKNPKLKDLCILKNYFNAFNVKDVDPKKVFLIDSNGIGASSLEEIRTKSCDSVNTSIFSLEPSRLIYPNPATDFIFIKGNGSENTISDIQIIDGLGKKYPSAVSQRGIDIRHLLPGYYYINWQDHNNIFHCAKFIKW